MIRYRVRLAKAHRMQAALAFRRSFRGPKGRSPPGLLGARRFLSAFSRQGARESRAFRRGRLSPAIERFLKSRNEHSEAVIQEGGATILAVRPFSELLVIFSEFDSRSRRGAAAPHCFDVVQAMVSDLVDPRHRFLDRCSCCGAMVTQSRFATARANPVPTLNCDVNVTPDRIRASRSEP